MNELSIKNNSKHKFLFRKDFNNILECFVNIFKYKHPIKVDVLITTNEEIRQISKEYRNINKETDVLSFPFEFKNLSSQLGFIFLGEIILSYEKIKSQANKFNHSIRREICYLFAHGLVHLSGRDHKKSKQDEKEFNSLVELIMNKLEIFRN